MKKRVVITGIGIVSSIGVGIDAFTEAIKNGKTGVAKAPQYETRKSPSYIAGVPQNINLDDWIMNQNKEHIGNASKLSIAASRLALEDARMDISDASKITGVCIGTTDGEAYLIEELLEKYINNSQILADPSLIQNIPPQEISRSVAREFSLNGDVLTISTACSASNYSIGYGYDLVASGNADVMLCGGVEVLGKKVFTGFSRLGSLAPEKCQPFDRDRKGLVPGEGSCVVVLETLESAQARGAKIYSEILGYGLSCDAYHMTASDPEGIAMATERAHRNAGVAPEEIDYISAHGTGTKTNDFNEVFAMKKIFKKKLPPISSIKSMIGHTFGAAGSMSIAACCAALYYSFLPPTINHENIDPSINMDIDCVPNKMRKAHLKIIQNNTFAFGGNNAIVILRGYHNE